MQTIIIVLDPSKMENPDLDIRYILPERIEEITKGMVKDNGYDYLPNNSMGIWLDTDDAEKNVKMVIELLMSEKILDNNLVNSAEIYVSVLDCAELDKCFRVYPD
jgi:hypothetical protein